MKFTYCPVCGKKAVEKEIGDEGRMPYCEQCGVPLWEMFRTSVICAVVNEYEEIALIRQSYVSKQNYVCIAGVMKPGETAEEAAVREIKEEIGLETESLTYIRSYAYEKKDMLMLGFRAEVKKADFRLSGEVDSAEWIPCRKAQELLRENGIAWQLVGEITDTDETPSQR